MLTRVPVARAAIVTIAIVFALAAGGLAAVVVVGASSQEDKASIRAAHRAAEIAGAGGYIAPKTDPSAAAPGAGAAMPQRVAGISFGPSWPSSDFVSNSFYQGPYGGRWVLVWVGSEVDPSTQAARVGSIYVETVPVDPNVGNSPQFAALVEAPDHSKSLSIVSLTGSTLTVSSSSGGRFDFDLSKNAFI